MRHAALMDGFCSCKRTCHPKKKKRKKSVASNSPITDEGDGEEGH